MINRSLRARQGSERTATALTFLVAGLVDRLVAVDSAELGDTELRTIVDSIAVARQALRVIDTSGSLSAVERANIGAALERLGRMATG